MAYTPTQFKAYNWAGSPRYKSWDVPIFGTNIPDGTDRTALEQQLAYEWLESGGTLASNRNPPFIMGSSGHLHPALRVESGASPRILRGFIRRADFDVSDPMTRTRLYFMYNPENITRDYVSYLDQGALDPFNTVFNSGNLVAPPSFMDFSFSLFFDRQEEANLPDNPGVFVDYQFFDMVVRNVNPTVDPNDATTLPDNGVMMVNPRDITVVFSPQMTVQGRPLNARVNFEKFTHRMTPTRMTIQLTMRVVYFGPMREQLEYKAEEARSEAAIPLNEIKVEHFNLTFRDLDAFFNSIDIDDLLKQKDIEQQTGNSTDANTAINKTALDWAIETVAANDTKYSEAKRQQFPGAPGNSFANASSMVWASYRHFDQDRALGWTQWCTSNAMVNAFRANNFRSATKIYVEDVKTSEGRDRIKDALKTKMQYGDLVFSYNVEGINPTVAWFMAFEDGKVKLFGAFIDSGAYYLKSFHQNLDQAASWYNWGVRPSPATSPNASNSSPDHGPTPEFTPGGADGAIPIEDTDDVSVYPDPPGSGPRSVEITPMAGISYNNIRLAKTANTAWKNWKRDFGGAIPCTSGWRSSTQQLKNWQGDPNRFAHPDKSYHCKGRAVDVNQDWINSLSAAQQTKLRTTAKANGWGQPRYKKGEAMCGSAPDGHKDNDEPWHFSWGGCG